MSRHFGDDWGVPMPDERSRAFFTAGKLVVQECAACSAVQHPPEEVCHACGGAELGWRECRGEGTVASRVVVHHPVHPALADHVPYAVVLVELADVPGVRLVGNVLGAEPHAIGIGHRVRVVFEEAANPGDGEPWRIPQWELAG